MNIDMTLHHMCDELRAPNSRPTQCHLHIADCLWETVTHQQLGQYYWEATESNFFIIVKSTTM